MRVLFTLLSIVLFLGFGTPASATAPATGHLHTLRGEITGVDPTTRTFTLQTLAGPEVKVHTADATRFRVDGNPATFDDLAVGQKARVRGRVKHGPNGHKGFLAHRVAAKS